MTTQDSVYSTQRTVSIEANTLTVNVSITRATEYSKERKEVSSYLKSALPFGTDLIVETDEGPEVNPAFKETVDLAAKEMMNICEVAAARQHGLTVESDSEGVIRVLNLFPGATAEGPATSTPGAFPAPQATVAPGAFSAPAAAAAPAPAPAPAQQQQQGWGGGGGGSFQRSTNPKKWSYHDDARQQQLADTLEAWCNAGGTGPEVSLNLTSRWPSIVVDGIDITPKTVGANRKFGPSAKAWLQALVGAGTISLD